MTLSPDKRPNSASSKLRIVEFFIKEFSGASVNLLSDAVDIIAKVSRSAQELDCIVLSGDLWWGEGGSALQGGEWPDRNGAGGLLHQVSRLYSQSGQVFIRVFSLNIFLLQAINHIRDKRPFSIETKAQVDSLFDFERHLRNQKTSSSRMELK